MTGDMPRPQDRPAAGSPDGQPGQEPGAGPAPVLDQLFDADSLYALRAAAEAHASGAGMREGRCGDLVIAVHELAANAVRHGAGAGRLRIWNLAGALHCRVTDAGARPPLDQAGGRLPASPAAAHDLALGWPCEHGHGLWMVRQLADQVSVHSGPGGTTATVTFVLPAARRSFRITRHGHGGRTVLAVAGDLDQGSAAELTAAVRALIATSPAVQLTLDLTAVAGWDSAGIAALITAQRHIDASPAATMLLAGMSGDFRQRLQAIDVTSRFTMTEAAGPADGTPAPSQ